MYSAGQIARAAAPVKTRMAMPAHLEAMITSPRLRPTFAPVQPVVDMAAIHAERLAKQMVTDAARMKAERRAKAAVDMENRRKVREAKLAMKRERDRRVKLGLMTDYRKNVDRHHRLIGILSQVTGLDVAEIKGPSRFKTIVKIRHIACWILQRNCVGGDGEQLTLTRLGRFMCGRHHTTIMDGIAKVNNRKSLLICAHEFEKQVLEIEAHTYGGGNDSKEA